MQRRQFLKTTGALGAESLTLSAPAAAVSSPDPYHYQPDHVTLTYDKSTLEKFRPLLVTRNLDRQPSWLYGWIASSTEHETKCAVYFAWYETQTSVVSSASHRGDREPIYVFYNPRTGTVESVLYDAYHYLRKTASGLTYYQDTHPQFAVNSPYHFYMQTKEEGTFVDLADLTKRYPDWVKNGWEVYRPGVVNPWVMQTRKDWWPDTISTFSATSLIIRTYLLLGFFGASQSDLKT